MLNFDKQDMFCSPCRRTGS